MRTSFAISLAKWKLHHIVYIKEQSVTAHIEI